MLGMYAGYQAMILIRNVSMLQSSSSKIEIYTILLHSPTKDNKYFDASSKDDPLYCYLPFSREA